MNIDIQNIKNIIIQNYKNNKLPDKEEFIEQLFAVKSILENENKTIRPYDWNKKPGGLINLKKNISTIIVPDLHGRGDFLLSILCSECTQGKSVLEFLRDNEIQLVCIGDGMHAESRAIKRWKMAFEEFKKDFRVKKNMTHEMIESFFVMQTVILLKTNFPDNFHYLKGNHDNILNENGNGNYPFAKFCYEGSMVEYFVRKFYGTDFLQAYSDFEKNLPLFCIGENFLISHAQPAIFYSKKDIIQYKKNPDITYGLTWTDNGSSQEGTVAQMLNYYLKDSHYTNKFYFGGHRPVTGQFHLLNKENFVQIHNPNKFVIVFVKPDREISLDHDIIELKNRIKIIMQSSL